MNEPEVSERQESDDLECALVDQGAVSDQTRGGLLGFEPDNGMGFRL